MDADDKLIEAILGEKDPDDLVDIARREADELRENGDEGDDERPATQTAQEGFQSEYLMSIPRGQQHNTGPKGVLEDYREAKEQLKKKMERDNRKKIEMIYKSTPTVRTILEDEEEARLLKELEIDESLLQQFMEQRMKELQRRAEAEKTELAKQQLPNRPKTFGKLYNVTAQNFIEFIDNEDKSVLIIIHLHLHQLRPCQRLNDCLIEIAENYPHIKFGKMLATEAQLSHGEDALPILMVYRGGELLKSFIQVTDTFGYNFDYDDIVDFLAEKGLLKRR